MERPVRLGIERLIPQGGGEGRVVVDATATVGGEAVSAGGWEATSARVGRPLLLGVRRSPHRHTQKCLTRFSGHPLVHSS